jgi:hypothetical protein
LTDDELIQEAPAIVGINASSVVGQNAAPVQIASTI